MVQLIRRGRDEHGAVALITALTVSTVLMVLAALVVDLGLARETKQASQVSADASALAAGNALYLASPTTPDFTAAVAAAKAYALANYGVTAGEWTTCTDSAPLTYRPGGTTCISFDSITKPTKVRVRMPVRASAVAFAGIVGVNNISVVTEARATLNGDGSQPCALCVLGPGNHNFQNGDATVAGGDIYLNGSVNVGANGLVASTGSIYVQTTATGPLANYQPDPITNVPPITDPLAGLQLPPAAMAALAYKTGSPCTGAPGGGGPGIYQGVNLRNSTCALAPGLYVIRAGTWDLAGNASTHLTGTGVTIYVTCSSGAVAVPCAANQAGGSIDSSGNGTLDIKAPTSGALAGLAIVYDRNNTSQLRLTGNGSGGFTGSIYMKSGTLQMNGNGCSSVYNSMIVVGNVDMNGNPTCLNSQYTNTQNPLADPDLHLDR